ncbi:hypothetical protein N7454_003870 [Penicillium verhagenii]|nr:hypothetical protein N7454_003870 [Penicillium verhagenii]
METRNQPSQPAQPPKEAAYAQASNPVSHYSQEQRASLRQHGDASSAITRDANSNPSNDEARARLGAQRSLQQERLYSSPDVDLEYGVEEQPAEGYIADVVERKGMGMQRARAGAHAGPVGSAGGPGHPGFGEQRDLAAHMDEKRRDHDRMLSEKIGEDPSDPQYDVAARESTRQRKLRQDEGVDVAGAVGEASGDPVVIS